MKASELRGRAVISLAEAHKVGEVDNVLLDPATNQVLGFRVKHGVFGGAQVIPADKVQSVGPDAVMIPDREALEDRLSAAEAHPISDLDNLGKIRVVSESGTFVGNLGDVEIDPQAMTITEYYLSGSLWEHLTQGNKTFASAPGLRFGGELLIIPDAVAHALIGGAMSPANATANPPETPGTDSSGATPDSTVSPPTPTLPPLAIADAAPTTYPAPVEPSPAPIADDKARSGGGVL
jgi:uncharacterized protein YrrD